MRENYRSWKVNIEDFPAHGSESDQLAFLLRFAILAPSSHNSQPWQFRVSNRAIWVFADQSRRLKNSDKDDRQLFISLGCTITNILIAADYYGLSATVTHLPEKGDPHCAARIDFSFSDAGIKTSGDHHLIFSIVNRVNNRNTYAQDLPDKKFIDEVKGWKTAALHILFISDRTMKEQLADVALAAGIFAMEDTYFRQELSHYVKSNITKSNVGMPAFGMGISTPVSLFAPNMIKFLNMNRITVKNDEMLLKKFTPTLCVISTSANKKEDWISTGEVYERIAVAACGYGLSTAVWAAPVQIGEYYKDIQNILKTEFRPQMLFRVGYADKKMEHSPRIPVEKVLIPS
jgi:nitroreductase